ncbi:Hpt domain-containing protein [Pseudooceanicola sp.]|uniref:Hpt domain-containing protein n=1 Tax=Pseudooceanicola sp. TaxID=1914328 RepID=UPI00262AD056|nr:Hpt domain-containing protein [Pseudooceanicola sp.]MDF1854970.1 Hpt domain-containing protein [Pseudooceanicola sp.]
MIDWSKAHELIAEIGPDDFIEVAKLFLSDADDVVDALLPDEALARQLHYLRGSAVTMGFTAVAALCQQGEATIDGQRLDEIDLGEIARTYWKSRQIYLEELPRRLRITLTPLRACPPDCRHDAPHSPILPPCPAR